MNCEQVRTHLSLFLYGELSLDEKKALEEHLEACPECRQELETEKTLGRILEQCGAEVPTRLVTQCRCELREKLEHEASRRGGLRFIWRVIDFRLPLRIAQVAGAAALVAVGFLVARLTAPEPSRPVSVQVRQVELEPSGNLRMVIDETYRRKVTGAPEEEKIRQLLLDTARNAPDPSLRFEAVDILARNQGHRLAGLFQDLLAREEDRQVRLRCEKALRAMKASLETF